jgi:hypothetical protein
MMAKDPFLFDDEDHAPSKTATTRRSSAKAGSAATAKQSLTGKASGFSTDGKLHFSHRLVPHVAAKPIPTGELLKRLKVCH